MLQYACLARACEGSAKGLARSPELLAAFWGGGAEGGDDNCCRAKNDELDDAAAIEQVDRELHQDARGVCRSGAGGEFGVILERQREGMVRRGTQQAESKECHAPQNLECKRACGELNLGQAHNGYGDGGGGNCPGLAFALGEGQQRRVSDKADDACAQDKALCEHNAFSASEQPDIDVEAKLGGKEGEGEEREGQKRVDFRLAQIQGWSFGWTEQSCPRF